MYSLNYSKDNKKNGSIGKLRYPSKYFRSFLFDNNFIHGIIICHTAVCAGYTTSYGTGEMILDALNKGFHDISITIGGSATNDGGMVEKAFNGIYT